jgi:hypothetical protein
VSTEVQLHPTVAPAPTLSVVPPVPPAETDDESEGEGELAAENAAK